MENDNKKLFIGNLSYDITDQDLRQLLSSCGTVMSVKVFKDKGYAFVEMLDDNDAENVIANFNDKEISGRKIAVQLKMPKVHKKRRPIRRTIKEDETGDVETKSYRSTNVRGKYAKKSNKPSREMGEFKTNRWHKNANEDSQEFFLNSNSDKIYRHPDEKVQTHFSKTSRGSKKYDDRKSFSFGKRSEKTYSRTKNDNEFHGDLQTHFLKVNSDKIYRDPTEAPKRGVGRNPKGRGTSCTKKTSSYSSRQKNERSGASAFGAKGKSFSSNRTRVKHKHD